MFIMGLQGMPRRYYDYLQEFAPMQLISTIGSWILVAGLLLMVINLWRGMKHGALAHNNPWGAATLEWETTSPPPHNNFPEEPTLTRDPYDYEGISRGI